MSSIPKYNLSVDYHELFGLLGRDFIATAFIGYSFSGGQPQFRDVCQVRMEKGSITAFVRGLNYFVVDDLELKMHNSRHPDARLDIKGLFCLACEASNLEWVSP